MAIDIRGGCPLLAVFDMPTSIAFYRDVLGFEVIRPAIVDYGMKQLYVSDPDGFNLCFQWPATEENFARWEVRDGLDPRKVKASPPEAC